MGVGGLARLVRLPFPSRGSRHWSALPPILGGFGLLVLFLAQQELQPPRVPLAIAGLLALGLALWVLALSLAPRRAVDRSATAAPERRGVRRLPLALALGAAVVAWLASAAGTYTSTNVLAWIVAAGAWCFAWWPRPLRAPRVPTVAQLTDALRRNAWSLLALAVIVAVGTFFRFYQLEEMPSDPGGDHIEKLLDMHDLVSGERPIFLVRNGGREPAQFYFTLGLIKVLDFRLSFETLKYGTAFVGVLGILAVFLFAREVAGRAAGLFAAALFAISAWPVGTARIGVRWPYGPLATALALWLLFRYVRTGDRRDALACGVVIGLGLHGYTSFRVVPVLVPLLLGLAFVLRRWWARGMSPAPVAGTALIFATAFVTALPLARYAIDHPDRVSERMGKTFLKDDYRPASVHWDNALPTFLDNTWNALLAFNWRGDGGNPMQAVLFAPFLDVMTGAALLAGLVIMAYQVGARRDLAMAAVVVSVPILLLPSTLQLAVPDWNPSVSRLGSLAPVVFLIAALPFAFLCDCVRGVQGDPRTRALYSRAKPFLAMSAVAVPALAIAVHRNYDRYFHDYTRQVHQIALNTNEIAATMRTRIDRGFDLNRIYVLGYPYWVDARLLGFALGDPDWAAGHNPGPADPLPRPQQQEPLLFVLHPSDGRRRELAASFPSGSCLLVRSEFPGREFVLYTVPRQRASGARPEHRCAPVSAAS